MDDKFLDDLMSPKLVARHFRVHISTVCRWIFSGRLPGYRRSGRYFVQRADLASVLEPVHASPVRPRESILTDSRAKEFLRSKGYKV